MAKKIIVAIVGMAGSGKSTSSDHFSKLGLPVLRFGDQVDIGLSEQNLPLTQPNERKYREDLRTELGMEAMAIKIEPRVNKALKSSDIVILDGLYSWEEYLYLQKKFKNLFLLCIYSRPSIRYKRLKARTIRPLNKKEARSRDFAELENLNKGGPIAIADYLIKNNKQTKMLFPKLNQTLDLIKDSV
jgi:dephospho-CoA kinase